MSQSPTTDYRASYVTAFTEGARARHPHLTDDQCRAIAEHLAGQEHAALSTVHGYCMPTDDDERSDFSDVGSFLWGLLRERPELFGEEPKFTETPSVENGHD